jgi:hypothetical protein
MLMYIKMCMIAYTYIIAIVFDDGNAWNNIDMIVYTVITGC